MGSGDWRATYSCIAVIRIPRPGAGDARTATARQDVGAPFSDSAGHTWQTKQANLDAAGISGQKIASLGIVHDEQGRSIIDNIVVNNTTIGKPSK